MSKTDNTQPLLLQWADTTRPGGMNHAHRGEPCDYDPQHNIAMFRGDELDHCGRIAYYHGGMRSERITKADRMQLSQGVRRHTRQVLHSLKQSRDFEDFDLLPSSFEHWL
jgi:hypothetical protein